MKQPVNQTARRQEARRAVWKWFFNLGLLEELPPFVAIGVVCGLDPDAREFELAGEDANCCREAEAGKNLGDRWWSIGSGALDLEGLGTGATTTCTRQGLSRGGERLGRAGELDGCLRKSSWYWQWPGLGFGCAGRRDYRSGWGSSFEGDSGCRSTNRSIGGGQLDSRHGSCRFGASCGSRCSPFGLELNGRSRCGGFGWRSGRWRLGGRTHATGEWHRGCRCGRTAGSVGNRGGRSRRGGFGKGYGGGGPGACWGDGRFDSGKIRFFTNNLRALRGGRGRLLVSSLEGDPYGFLHQRHG